MEKKLFAVLGKSLPHTYSPRIHGMLTDEYEYVKLEKEEEELPALFEKGRKGEIGGFNVTIPYKKVVCSNCDILSDRAKATGAVNTVRFEDGRMIGDNTDVFGFMYMLKNAGIDTSEKKCMILGTGGASAAVCYALERSGAASIVFCSRTGEINYENVYEKAADVQVIINATPVGMYPDVDANPIDLSRFEGLEGAADIIYNPSRTRFLYQASELGVKTAGGLTMLVAQAYKAMKVFLGGSIDNNDMEELVDVEAINKIRGIVSELESDMKNITIIGMPGCGKSALAQELGKRLNREVVDLDIAYGEEYGTTPAQDIVEHGEDFFRERESACSAKFLSGSGRIISCGGGIVTRRKNDYYISCNSTVIYLKRPLSVLAGEDRPISARDGVQKLYENRREFYELLSDIVLDIPEFSSKDEFIKAAMEKLADETSYIERS